MKSILVKIIAVMCFSLMLTITSHAKTITLNWEDLIPPEGTGQFLVVPANSQTIGLPKREEFKGSDEDYSQMVESYEIQRYSQPQGTSIRTDLNGKTVKIPGFITPLEIDGENIVEFLLVPYRGACIHVPSPPGNQIIYVSNTKGVSLDKLYDPIWITGKLKASSMTTVLADVGYHIENPDIEIYIRK